MVVRDAKGVELGATIPDAPAEDFPDLGTDPFDFDLGQGDERLQQMLDHAREMFRRPWGRQVKPDGDAI